MTTEFVNAFNNLPDADRASLASLMKRSNEENRAMVVKRRNAFVKASREYSTEKARWLSASDEFKTAEHNYQIIQTEYYGDKLLDRTYFVRLQLEDIGRIQKGKLVETLGRNLVTLLVAAFPTSAIDIGVIDQPVKSTQIHELHNKIEDSIHAGVIGLRRLTDADLEKAISDERLSIYLLSFRIPNEALRQD